MIEYALKNVTKYWYSINFKSIYICIQVTNMFEKEMEVWDKIAQNLCKIYDSWKFHGKYCRPVEHAYICFNSHVLVFSFFLLPLPISFSIPHDSISLWIFLHTHIFPYLHVLCSVWITVEPIIFYRFIFSINYIKCIMYAYF